MKLKSLVIKKDLQLLIKYYSNEQKKVPPVRVNDSLCELHFIAKVYFNLMAFEALYSFLLCGGKVPSLRSWGVFSGRCNGKEGLL